MKKLLILFALLTLPILHAQDLDSIMQGMNEEADRPVLATFKSPKLVLLQTNETQHKQDLTLWISHRFGDIGGEFGGSHTLFGLDEATDIHIGLDYGITDEFTMGIGRSRFNETYNIQAKYALVQQMQTGTPFSLTLFGQSSWITREENFANEFTEESERISHFLQLILARRFSRTFSLMINPGYIIRPRVAMPGDQEDFFIVGMGGRLQLWRNVALIADYTLVRDIDRPDLKPEYYNPLGIGIEIQTGGHVFSLNFQNATFITPNNFIPYTYKSWTDGGVRFGFTISRNFYLGLKKESERP